MDNTSLAMLSMWNPSVERCGIVMNDGEVREVLNYAIMLEAGQCEFAMRTDDVMRVRRDGEIRGIFHTHPSNNPRPSLLDIAGWPMVPEYYVVTEHEVSRWKLVGSNPILIAQTRSSLDNSVF